MSTIDTDLFWAPRPCLLPATQKHEVAADLLSLAIRALIADRRDAAIKLIKLADFTSLHEHARRVMAEEPAIQRRRSVPRSEPAGAERAARRMPSPEAERRMYERDGWRCRYCGCRVVLKPALHRLRKLLPGAINWPAAAMFDADGNRVKHHGAFYALNAVADHVVPHAAGGTNELDNLVTTCWPCNFGKAQYTLEECGLLDPFSRPPVVDGEWDGLGGVLRACPTTGAADYSFEQALGIYLAGQHRRADAATADAAPDHGPPAAVGDRDDFAGAGAAAAPGQVIEHSPVSHRLSRQDLIAGVKVYARKNYDRNGWHLVVDGWSDDDIDRVIGLRTKSVLGAIQMMVQVGGFREQAMGLLPRR